MEKKFYTEEQVENMGNWEATNLLMEYMDFETVEQYFNEGKFLTIKLYLFRNLKDNGLVK